MSETTTVFKIEVLIQQRLGNIKETHAYSEDEAMSRNLAMGDSDLVDSAANADLE